MSRYARVLLVLALLLHLAMLASWRLGFLNGLFFDSTVTQGWRGWDFFALYQAGHNVLTGHSVYESAGDRIEVVVPRYTPFRYLPIAAYTVGVALNALPPLWAFRVWVALVEGIYLLSLWLLLRRAPSRNIAALLAALWLGFTPYYLELYLGQFSVIQAFFVLVMLLAAYHRELNWRFDMAWVASLLWKVNTGLFIPLLFRLRRWRALIVAGIAVLLTTFPYFLQFPDALGAFLGNFRAADPWFQHGNLGVRQLLFDLLWCIDPEMPSEFHRAAQWAVVGIGVGVPLALLLADRRPDVVDHLSLWMVTYFVVYHHVWEHHYVMALPVLGVQLLRRPRAWWLWGTALFLALPTPYIWVDPHGMAAVQPAMRWTPIRPLWKDLLYHASKAVPILVLYGGLAGRLLGRIREKGAR